jgi:predicted nucleotidyltransferase
MRTKAPPLLPIFRSRVQGDLLAATLLHPTRRESVSELARRLGADVATVQREVSRLERAGILRTTRVGRTRLVEADRDSPLHGPLKELVLRVFRPAHVAEEFESVVGIDEMYVFGSWAARYLGEEGPDPGDIDLLLVGSPDRDEVYQAALRAERRLGREVNTTIRSRDAWESSADGFLRQLRSSPIVPLSGYVPA